MDFAAARQNMVECQLRPNRATDPRVVEAMGAVPRERFVPVALRDLAYVDEDLDIGSGRFLMEPMVFARLIQAAQIAPDDAVLDIACGLGCSSAVLARLARTVVALEQNAAQAAEAARLLREVGAGNVQVANGPLAAGWPSQAPYDVIVIEGAVPEVPPALVEQLGEGGRLVAVVNPGRPMGQAVLAVRRGGVLAQRILFDATTPRLPEFAREPGFVF
jgi:protein-L-isoaspartate(D-aspartate) O-methyltransferase